MFCIQETKWKRNRARALAGGYKMLHVGGDGESNGVGIIVSEKISKEVVRVESWQGRIIVAWVMVKKQIVCIMSVYGAQTGRAETEKRAFKDELERMVGLVEVHVMMCLAGGFNVHVGTAETGEEELVGGFGWGRNREDRELVELVMGNGLAVAGTFFKKREKPQDIV